MAFKDLLKKFVPGEEIAEGVPEVFEPEEKKKKRTTPQDDAKRTRNSQVKIRLTEEEVAELKAAASAAGISLADFVMTSAKNKSIVICKYIPGLLVELRSNDLHIDEGVYRAAVSERGCYYTNYESYYRSSMMPSTLPTGQTL